MKYVMKQNPIINAIKFMGFQNEETLALGLQPIPSHVQIQCTCGYGSQNHLLFNKHLVCPNNYIIYEGAEVTGVMSIDKFEAAYKPLTWFEAKFKEVDKESKPDVKTKKDRAEKDRTDNTTTKESKESISEEVRDSESSEQKSE